MNPTKSETSAVLAARRIGLLTGKRFGRYEVRRLVGTGGMGAVYEARDTQLDRIVALKLPRSELVNDPTVLQRFLNEARAAGAIRHPNICPIYHVGQLDGQHFITMPLVQGMSLSAWMEHRTVSLHEAAELTRKLASALQAIHSAGIRHRDIKASNVMIDERGEPLLMDFGLARLAQADTHVTQSGSLVGTPAYMAPEQIQLGASGGDERSDVYSLGVLLYQMLSGRLPFEGPMTRVLVDIATKDAPLLETMRPDVDAALASVCRKAMSRNPSHRFQTAAERTTGGLDHLLRPCLVQIRIGWREFSGAQQLHRIHQSLGCGFHVRLHALVIIKVRMAFSIGSEIADVSADMGLVA